ncbi:MAG: hypothetical protein NXY59_06000 [Aigarchaeota archaeon]|nr:hypothetical protein [Candidatus Pelearchaeum maunauluense]
MTIFSPKTRSETTNMPTIRDQDHEYRDHDYIETPEGWIFCVVSDNHPPGRVMAFLKYMPGDGKWSRDGQRYTRVVKSYTMEEIVYSIDLLKKVNQRYVHYDETIGETFTYIPLGAVERHYRCEERFSEILENNDFYFSAKCRELANILESSLDVRREFLGLTGSLLVGLHNPHADIDLIVYGGDNFWRIASGINELQSQHDRESIVSAFTKSLLKRYPLTLEDAQLLASRLRNRGIVSGTLYSVHAVKFVEEITERYGDKLYKSMGVAKTKLTIINSKDSCFTPAVYEVEGEEKIGGRRVEIKTLTCYDTTFSSLFHAGDVVEVLGKIELVKDRRQDKEYLNILIGSQAAMGREYIRLLKEA